MDIITNTVSMESETILPANESQTQSQSMDMDIDMERVWEDEVKVTYSPDTYFIHFRAKLGLYTYGPTFGSDVTYPPSHFEKLVDEETFGEIRKKIKNLNLPEELLSPTFECYDSTTDYFINNVYFMARFNTNLSHAKIAEEIESYLWCFNEIAGDTYFEGDAVVYREPLKDAGSSADAPDEGEAAEADDKGSEANEADDSKYTSYMLVMDDIEVLIYNHDYTEKVCSMMTGTHWFKKE
jgi:hypothetical protein